MGVQVLSVIDHYIFGQRIYKQVYSLFLPFFFFHLYFQQCPHIVTIMSYHHSYAFTFNATTLFSSLHFITHKYSYAVPYHCSHNFYFISSFTFSAVFISSFICIHPQCHHTVFITSFPSSYVFHIQCYTLFLNFIHIFSSAITVSINSFHYSYTFTFSAITLFSSLHFIAHIYSHSVPSHCCHNFLFFIHIFSSAIHIHYFTFTLSHIQMSHSNWTIVTAMSCPLHSFQLIFNHKFHVQSYSYAILQLDHWHCNVLNIPSDTLNWTIVTTMSSNVQS